MFFFLTFIHSKLDVFLIFFNLEVAYKFVESSFEKDQVRRVWSCRVHRVDLSFQFEALLEKVDAVNPGFRETIDIKVGFLQ